jgi:SAM-dependent methyltransferase
MSDVKTFDPIWDEIYDAGQQLNRYPFDSIVTFVFRHRPRDKARGDVRILEIGCGAGNNLWFCAREGFDVVGIDASAPAIAFAENRFAEDGLNGQFQVADFTDLPFGDNSFDMVLERAAITQAPKAAARQALVEAARVLKPGGMLYSEIYSDRATARGPQIPGEMQINEEGPYAGVGQMALWSKTDIDAGFAPFEIVSLSHSETIIQSQKPYEVMANWNIEARKPG